MTYAFLQTIESLPSLYYFAILLFNTMISKTVDILILNMFIGVYNI